MAKNEVARGELNFSPTCELQSKLLKRGEII